MAEVKQDYKIGEVTTSNLDNHRDNAQSYGSVDKAFKKVTWCWMHLLDSQREKKRKLTV